MMKRRIITGLFIFATMLIACNEDELVIEPNQTSGRDLQSAELTTLKTSNINDEVPELTFTKTASKENEYIVHMVLPKDAPNGNYILEIKPDSENSTEEITTINFNNVKGSAIATGVQMTFKNGDSDPSNIVFVNIYSSSNDKPIMQYSYSAFVFENGKTALYKPQIGTVHFIDDWQGETVYLEVSVEIENNPGTLDGLVKVVMQTRDKSLIAFNDLVCTKKWSFGQKSATYSGNLSVESNVFGSIENVNITLLDSEGKTLGTPDNQIFMSESADFSGRIRRIRIRENISGSNFRTIVGLVENMDAENFDHAEIQIEPIDDAPAPLSNSLNLLKDDTGEWDQLMDESLSVIMEQGAFIVGNNSVLAFDKSVIGYSYKVTSTIFNPKGKTLGDIQIFKVTVESDHKDDEPILLSNTLNSRDGGKTWDLTIKIQDNGQWVDKAVYEFVAPFEGPEPTQNPISLTWIGEEPGNIEIYSASNIIFKGDAAGLWYSGIVYLYGIGTRKAASQADGKAELL